MDSIYLDYCATTPIDPAVIAAMNHVQEHIHANPSSQHRAGRLARTALEDAAEEILRQLGAVVDRTPADRIVLTSGGTEANNLALLGQPDSPGARLLVSSLEHPSTLAAADQLRRRGWVVETIHARQNGTIDLDHFRQLLDACEQPPRLVSLMLGNHETGVLQPVRDVVDRCQRRGVPVHCDAVQAIGKIPVNFHELGVTFMTVAAHKFHGPVGIGALVVRGKTPLQSILHGGSQQLGTRPGTESVALAVGMQVALQLAHEQLGARTRHLKQCRDELERRLTGVDELGVEVNGTAPRLPHVLNVSFSHVDRQALLMALDLAGVYCSSGSACASGSSEPSHVLRTMGLPADRVRSALRLSVGATTKTREMAPAAERILKAAKQLRA